MEDWEGSKPLCVRPGRKGQLKCGSAARRLGHDYLPFMEVDDLLHDGQAETGAWLTVALAPEGFEDRFSIAWGDPNAVVDDGQRGSGADFHKDGATFGFGAQRIVDEIAEGALQRAAVAENLRRTFLDDAFDFSSGPI